MHHYYGDILSRIAQPPKWWDEHAVPRYCQFKPNEVANIYACECVLLLIRCQSCNIPFKVAMSVDSYVELLSKQIAKGVLHYGDPPNNECCPTGLSMNSEPDRVLQFWSRDNKDRKWIRDKKYEVKVTW
jgi:hypothetical protein